MNTSEPARTINRLLVANRGEIARRIMSSCAKLGIETVAVYSDADSNAAFVADADFSVALGGNTPAESYLRIDAILDAAARTGSDAIHPGYGFLAENAQFAEAVIAAGLIFVGPSPEVIEVMGSKLASKERMAAAGVPLLPSADLTGLNEAGIEAAAADVGYPVLIKASAGGGGRGMRIVVDPAEVVESVQGAAREAASAFGDGTVYAERYVSPSRHVEVQIFGDDQGNVVHFHERECSIQRRHQKIIEEAPSASLDPATRSALHAAAVQAGKAIGYTNAGTVEFLLAPAAKAGDAGRADGPEFFFLEVNTRLQVEHPVTEAVLDVDLVALQLHVAQGGGVPAQDDIGPVTGHAMEARLYAEDPRHDFRPSTGIVEQFVVPGDVRLDTALLETGVVEAPPIETPMVAKASVDTKTPAGEVSQFYDPMIAKVIVHAETRNAAARRLAQSLQASVVDGIATNRELLVRTLRHPEFLGDQGDSAFLTRNDPAVLGRPLVEGADAALAAAVAALSLQTTNRLGDCHTASVSSGFRNVATKPQSLSLSYEGASADEPGTLEVQYLFRFGRLEHLSAGDLSFAEPVLHAASPSAVDLTVNGVRQQFVVRRGTDRVSVTGTSGTISFGLLPRFTEPGEQVAAGSTVAAMPGTIVSVSVVVGDEVAAGDVLLVMEAMKMEMSIKATTAGVVTEIGVAAGEAVEAGAVLATVSEPATP